MLTYQHAGYLPQSTLDSSHNTSSASLVTGSAFSAFPSPAPSPVPSQPLVEVIPHRIFVGGFPSSTTEAELRSFFEKYGHIREAKVIRTVEGSPKGYGFVTFDSEEEAQTVRHLQPEKLEFKGRRLNLGPAVRRLSQGIQGSRFADFGIATPTTPIISYQTAAPNLAYPSYYQASSVPQYVLVSPPNQQPSFIYSPVSPVQQQPIQFQQHMQNLAETTYAMQNGQPQAFIPIQNSANQGDRSCETIGIDEVTTGISGLGVQQGSPKMDPNNTPLTRRQPQQSRLRFYQQQRQPQIAHNSYYPTADMTHYSQMSATNAVNY